MLFGALDCLYLPRFLPWSFPNPLGTGFVPVDLYETSERSFGAFSVVMIYHAIKNTGDVLEDLGIGGLETGRFGFT